MDTNIKTTGDRIKYLRETVNKWNGKTFLAELKRVTGEVVRPSALSNHEKDTSMPAYKTIVNYAKVLGTTTDFLLLVTEDPSPTKKNDRNVVIEAKGEEERRILEETSSLLEEMNVGDLRFVLDIIRRISSVPSPVAPKEEVAEFETLIEMVIDLIEKFGGKEMRDKAIDELERALPSTPPMKAMWRRIRTKRKN